MEQKIIYKGPGVLSILGIAFIILKLVGVIEWSWWWVTLPFWGPLAFLLLLIITMVVAALVNVCLDNKC